MPGFAVAIDEGAGGDSSKSNSITSERSIQSVGIVSASSQSSSTNSIPPMHDHDDPSNHFPQISIRPRARGSFVSIYTELYQVNTSFDEEELIAYFLWQYL